MILSDRQIHDALRLGQVRITPPPDDLTSDAWSSTALDLRLDARLQVWKAPDDAGTRLVVASGRAPMDETNTNLLIPAAMPARAKSAVAR